MKKAINLSLMAAVFFSIISCAALQGDNRPELVKQKLIEQLNSESKGALTLISFTKTNGADQNTGGFQAYQVEFDATISVSKFCIKPGNGYTGYFENFWVILEEPTDIYERNNLSIALRLQAGQQVQLKCTATLIKKDNGWEAGNISVVSYRIL